MFSSTNSGLLFPAFLLREKIPNIVSITCFRGHFAPSTGPYYSRYDITCPTLRQNQRRSRQKPLLALTTASKALTTLSTAVTTTHDCTKFLLIIIRPPAASSTLFSMSAAVLGTAVRTLGPRFAHAVGRDPSEGMISTARTH